MLVQIFKKLQRMTFRLCYLFNIAKVDNCLRKPCQCALILVVPLFLEQSNLHVQKICPS